jgi:transposase
MSEEPTKSKRPYFRESTPDQRRLLFETYERTGSIAAACAAAHLARRTFYFWRLRFRAGGYAALAQTGSHAPHRTRIPPTPAETVAEVIAYKQAHLAAGYRSIANGLKQAHHWQAVISATQVRRILLRAGLVAGAGARPPAADPPVAAVHAPEPAETLNIDLCLVPLAHAQREALQPVTISAAAKGDFSPSAAPAED